MKAVWRVGLLLALQGAGVGCGGPEVDIAVRFAAENAFLWSDFGRLLIYEGARAEEEGGCAGLLRKAEVDDYPEAWLDTGWTPICQWYGNGVTLPDVGSGARVFLAVSKDQRNQLVASGCQRIQLSRSTERLTVPLNPTEPFSRMFLPPPDDPPDWQPPDPPCRCRNAEEKCAR